MNVIEFDLDSWYLLSDDRHRYFDVRSGFGGYSFWLLIELNSVEWEGYENGGRYYIQALADSVRRRPHKFSARNEPVEKQREVYEFLMAWLQKPRPNSDP